MQLFPSADPVQFSCSFIEYERHEKSSHAFTFSALDSSVFGRVVDACVFRMNFRNLSWQFSHVLEWITHIKSKPFSTDDLTRPINKRKPTSQLYIPINIYCTGNRAQVHNRNQPHHMHVHVYWTCTHSKPLTELEAAPKVGFSQCCGPTDSLRIFLKS